MSQLRMELNADTQDQIAARENEEKGLTHSGYTRTYDGEHRTFTLNGVEITCTVDYDLSLPHLEFTSETPSILTSTGYRSHFEDSDLSSWPTLELLITSAILRIIHEKHPRKAPPYTLSFYPVERSL